MRKSTITRSLLALLSVSLMICFIGRAEADPDAGDASSFDNAAFLASLLAAGISYSQEDQAVISGKAVCRLMDSGKSGPDVVLELEAHNRGLANDDAARFVGIAARTYCPHQLRKSTPEAAH